MEFLPSIWKTLLTLALLVICRLIFKFVIKPYFMLQRFKNVPGAQLIFSPVIGNLLDIQKDFEKHNDAAYSMKQQISQNPDTRMVVMTLASGIAVMLTDLELIKEFLSKQTKIAIKDKILDDNQAGSGVGLAAAEGDRWKAQRKLISQSFHFDYMNYCMPLIGRTIKEWIDDTILSSDKPVNISFQSKIFSSTVIWRMFFGEESYVSKKTEAKDLIALLLKNANVVITRVLDPKMWLFGPKFFRLGLRALDREHARDQKKLDDFFNSKFNDFKKKILEENQSGKQTDRPRYLIELLFSESLKAGAEEKMSDADILAQIRVFFLAGTDTTAQLITMSHYLMSAYPEVQEKLREEVLKIIGDEKEVRIEDLSKLEYMTAFFKESLRCYPPIGSLVGRKLLEHTTIGDLKLEKGSHVNISITSVSYNPKHFDQPEIFRPERWLEKDRTGVKDNLPFIIFSGGARRCIGEQLVYIEAKSLLVELLRRFKIDIQKPYQLRMGLSVIYEAKDPINVIYTKL